MQLFLLQVVDYKKTKFADVYKDDPFDIVVDCMGKSMVEEGVREG